MKKILFLLLFPTFAIAQYTGNANQKITLGEQTTADGLVYRGLAADTTRKPSVDTMAYIILDTATNVMWQYKKATSNAWLRVGGSISSGLTGTLPVANGGTGATTFTAGRVLFGNGTSAINTNADLFWDNSNSRLGIGTPSPTYKLDVNGTGSFSGVLTTSANNGAISVGGTGYTLNPTNMLIGRYTSTRGYVQVPTNGTFEIWNGGTGEIAIFNETGKTTTLYGALSGTSATFSSSITAQYIYDNTDAGAANVFVTTGGLLKRSTSSIKYKTEVEDYTKGLSDVLKLRPVTYKSINSNDNKIYAGFIAEELSDLKLSELLQNNEEGEPDAISYAYIVTLLTKAIQDQNVLIKELEKRILTLENK